MTFTFTPQPIKIATWNINSVRLRMPLVAQLVAEASPDILCLQETKCPDEAFPRKEMRKLGYEHQAFWGMKGYNGVAIVSRVPLVDPQRYARCAKQDCRHLSVTVDLGPRHSFDLHNLYIPAGGYEPDPVNNYHFQHKLDFLDELTAWLAEGADWHHKPAMIVGDLNVAPLEHDVWSHRQMLDVVSHTPMETQRFERMLAGNGWIDAMRRFVPDDQKLYTWWSYRAADWALSNRGRRLDHIWTSPPLAPRLGGLGVLREARGWQRPSDHVPVIITLNP